MRAIIRVLKMKGVDMKASDIISHMKVLYCGVLDHWKIISKYLVMFL